MRPSLTGRGLAVAGLALVMLIGGALIVAWPLIALGFGQLSLLLAAYLLFTPRVAVFRQKCLEFAWWIPTGKQQQGAIRADREMTIRLLFRNRSPVALRGATVSLLGSDTISFAQRRLRIDLPAGQEQRYALEATPRATGSWFLQGALIRVCDHLGVFALHAYFPNRLSVRVFPPLVNVSQRLPLRPRTGTAHERAGPRLLRQRGLGSDLRELRDHTPGDPFKRIAWKASARSRRLIVREFESEILLTLQLVLDISPTMRGSLPAAQTKLERSVRFTASLARAALDMGDRVGLWTFDFRLHRHVSAGDGVTQMQRVLDHLLELHQVLDEDLTNLTDAELYTIVARYLAYQEGADTRLDRTPALDSSQWEDLVIGANGEAIDGEALERAAYASLARQVRKHDAGRLGRYLANVRAHAPASNDRLGLLRLFCRFRGIALPYRDDLTLQSKQQGMVQALVRAAGSHSTQLLVLVTDLQNVGDAAELISTLKLCRQRRQAVSIVTPKPAAPACVSAAEGVLLSEIEQLQALQQTAGLRRLIQALGIPIVPLGESDGFNPLVRSIVAQHRGAVLAQ